MKKAKRYLDGFFKFCIPSEKDVLPVALRILIGFVILFTTAMLIECVIFQFNAVVFRRDPITFGGRDHSEVSRYEISYDERELMLSAEESRSIIVERNNQQLIAQYLGKEYEQKQDDTLIEKPDGSFYRKVRVLIFDVSFDSPIYINKLKLYTDAAENGNAGYQAVFYRGDKQRGDAVYTSIEPKIHCGIGVINRKADRLRVEVMTAGQAEPEDMEFTLSNDFRPNILRVLWIFVFLLTGILIAEKAQIMEKKPEWAFAFICFTAGVLIIMGVGTNQISYDEHVHAKAAYKLSFFSQIETTEAAMQMSGNLLPLFNNLDERKLVEEYEQQNHDYSWADIGFQSRFVRSENRVYYPLALGFFLGRILGLSFAHTVALAKLFNLLSYTVICYFAVKKAVRYKELVLMTALLPGSLFLAASISYDMVVNSCLLLSCVLMYNEFLEPETKLEWSNLLVMLLSFVYGCQSKPVYILMACMVLFYGKKKFNNTFQAVVCKLAVLIIAGLMLYNIFRPTPVAGSDYVLVSNISYAGDKRNVGSSVMGQIQYIFSHPFNYTLLLLSSMKDEILDYLVRGKGFFQYGYAGAAPMLTTYVMLAAGIYIAFFGPAQDIERSGEKHLRVRKLSKEIIILTVIMCFGMSAVIWTSMYVSYTQVGADVINGVQGRYFTPLFLPLLLCLLNDKHRGRLKRTGRMRLACALCAYLNLFMIWFLILRAYDR